MPEPTPGSGAEPAEQVSPATAFSLALLTELCSLGLRDVVVCPGSRSQALALAAVALEKAGALRVHVRIDERSAAFFALGLGLETGRAAAVITTSGTAVANLHPAVLEAHHSFVPLLVLSADRPDELRGIRSNQTTVQPGVFGGAVRWETDQAAPTGAPGERDRAREIARSATDAAHGRAPSRPGAGPVHLNLSFREPLSSATGDDAVPALAAEVERRAAAHADPGEPAALARPGILLERGPRTVVIAGNAAGAVAEALAHAGGWPLIAEVTSGSRYGRNLVAGYRELLADAGLGGRVERAVVFGHPTLSREVPALLRRDGVEAIVVAPEGAEAYDPGRRARVVGAASVVDGPADRAWLGAWITASRRLAEERDRDVAPDLAALHSEVTAERQRFAREEFAAVRERVDRELLVQAVWRATWPHDRLVLGASRLIRVADEFVAGKKITVRANRGLAGIDGTIATAHGIAYASQRAADVGTTRVLLGDLALLHDVGSLLGGHGEAWPRLQVVVGNDGGGTIFDGLEVARSASPADIDRVQYTPQSADIASIAAGYGWEHVRVSTRAALDQALTSPRERPVVIEVPLER